MRETNEKLVYELTQLVSVSQPVDHDTLVGHSVVFTGGP